jgi:hypothetical protein
LRVYPHGRNSLDITQTLDRCGGMKRKQFDAKTRISLIINSFWYLNISRLKDETTGPLTRLLPTRRRDRPTPTLRWRWPRPSLKTRDRTSVTWNHSLTFK